VRNPVPPIVRIWRWGIALIIAVGLLGACPLLTGTYIPFFLVCFQVLPAPLKRLLLLLTIADRLAGHPAAGAADPDHTSRE
jgi:hypothetical protein